jgi:prepilin-type N-terminal cleavage/methylation domain-containing protein/prepilin-type processing-associated H-X9-DG protein
MSAEPRSGVVRPVAGSTGTITHFARPSIDKFRVSYRQNKALPDRRPLEETASLVRLSESTTLKKSPAFGFTLVELVVVIAILAILAGLLMPALSSAKQRATSARCISNLRQQGMAVRLYADENQGRLPRARDFAAAQTNAPDALPGIDQVLGPQVRGVRDVFKCPADKDKLFARDGSSYEWNTSLNGRMLIRLGQDSPDEANAFLLRDRNGWHPRGRKNAVFVDGHTGPVDL